MQKFLVGFAAFAATVVAQAATWTIFHEDHVPVVDGKDVGETVMTPVQQLTNAFAQAVGGSTIIIKPGEYDLSGIEPQNEKDTAGKAYLFIPNTTLVVQGENTKHWSEKTASEETVLKVTNATARLIYAYAGSGRASKFRHLTLDGGNAGADGGGAIHFMDNRLGGYATNCVFRNNSSPSGKGGATRNVPTYDCLYENNSAVFGGGHYGGICTYNTTSVTNPCIRCVFRCNRASGNSSDYGGGAIASEDNVSESLIIRDCVFEGNTSARRGGAVFVKYGQTLPDCVFVTNSVTGSSFGGAVGSLYGYVRPIRCAFTNNFAKNGGGAVYCYDGFTATNCTFVGNSAEKGDGGAVRCSSADSVVDVEFTNNSSTNGGAFYSSARLTDMARCSFVSNWSSKICGSMNCSGYTRISACVFSNNVAAVDNAGIYAGYYPDAGTVENCVFYNNTNRFANVGSQISGAANVIGCTFGGYGDYTRVKNYDRCVFDGCSFDYDDYGSGMIVFDTMTMEGHVRNCLFKNNNVHIYIKNAVGSNVEIANCTFVGNSIIKAWNARGNQWSDGFLFYSFRGGTDPNDSKKQLPSTNIVVNCTFADNTRDGARNDVNFYVTGTSVATPAVNVFSNSVYEIASFVNNPTIQGNLIVGRAKFTAGDPKYGDDVPYYMPRRGSPARKAGLWLDWMAGAKDLAGADMPSAAPVDLGCYQCTLPSLGLLLLLR